MGYDDYLQPFRFIECHAKLAKGIACTCAFCAGSFAPGYYLLKQYTITPCAFVSPISCAGDTTFYVRHDGHIHHDVGDRTRIDAASTATASTSGFGPIASTR